MNTSWVNGLIENNKRVNFFLVINCILIVILAFQSKEISKLDTGMMLVSEFIVWLVTFLDEIKYKHLLGHHRLLIATSMAGMPLDKKSLITCVSISNTYKPMNLACAIINILPLTNVLSRALSINSATGMALTYFTILEIIYISFMYFYWHYISLKYKSFLIKEE
jgi:hypothetical protein